MDEPKQLRQRVPRLHGLAGLADLAYADKIDGQCSVIRSNSPWISRVTSRAITSYRSDIDGLRAIAVLLVVGFHAFPGDVPGGFVGVDIFLVISGFLISGVILNGQRTGNFSFVNFYAGRIRRIFPALIVVLASCMIFGWIVLLPTDYAHLGTSTAAGATFVYNFILFNEQGYFDIASEMKPLLHLWSLGVEEQFYLVWPALMFLGSRKKGGTLVILKIIFLLSFGANIVLTTINEPAAFYLPFSRFWELMLGSILAIAPFHSFARLNPKEDNATKEAASWIGALLLVLAVLLISMTRPFPGWWALLPTCGTALLIFAGKDARPNRRLLSSPVMVYIGLLSYPLYLWHWPILTFTRILRIEEPTALMKAACILAAFILAHLTYRFVEQPIRFQAAARTLKTIMTSTAMAAIAIVGAMLSVSEGVPSRFLAEARNLLQDYSKESVAAWRAKGCFINVGERFGQCDQATDETKIVVWGDSHAAQLVPGLQDLAQRRKLDVIQYTISSCAPVLAFEPTPHQKQCSDAFEAVANKIGTLQPDTVIVAGFWQSYYLSFDGKRFDEAIYQTVRRLKSMGVRRVVGVGQFPVWRSPPQFILSRSQIPLARFLNPNLDPKLIGLANKNYLNAFDDGGLKSTFLSAGATFISPKSTLCDGNGCQLLVPGGNGVPMDGDTNHLTVPGSIYFAATNERALLED
jgi:peptidoglycan/LPS O-acetylase OafA/YrhL